jgi:hypothetical protein
MLGPFRVCLTGLMQRKGKEDQAAETVWKELSMQNHISTSVLYEGHLYGFSEHRLRCVDFQTGKVVPAGRLANHPPFHLCWHLGP